MEIVLEPQSRTPIYQQLRDRIVEAIANGGLRYGEALQSVRGLAVAFGINPATVVKAYDSLREDGFLTTNAKSGSVVACDPDHPVQSSPSLDWHDRVRMLFAEEIAKGVPLQSLLDECDAVAMSFTGGDGGVQA